MTHAVDHQTIGAAGEFFASGKLFKRGYQVSLTIGNAKAIDLFVHNPRTNRTFKVQVKTQRRKNCFPVRKEAILPDEIYVFVRLNGLEENEEYYILSGQIILEDIDKFFGSSYANPERPGSMPAINYGPLLPFKDKWDIFDENF